MLLGKLLGVDSIFLDPLLQFLDIELGQIGFRLAGIDAFWFVLAFSGRNFLVRFLDFLLLKHQLQFGKLSLNLGNFLGDGSGRHLFFVLGMLFTFINPFGRTLGSFFFVKN